MSKPDFESGKGYYWMRQSYEAERKGMRDKLPHKPREYNPNKYDARSKEHAKTVEFNKQVDIALSRRTF